jgi:phage protein, HK97 gp10 family
MKVTMDYKELDDLVRAFEKAASEYEIAETNKKIIKRSQPIVKKIMQKKIPKSTNMSKSGRNWGTRGGVSAHAADSIPVGGIRTRGTSVSTDIGWKKSDTSEHFYVKFINWGTIYQPPREFIFSSGREADGELLKIAEEEYQAFMDRTVG